MFLILRNVVHIGVIGKAWVDLTVKMKLKFPSSSVRSFAAVILRHPCVVSGFRLFHQGVTTGASQDNGNYHLRTALHRCAPGKAFDINTSGLS